MSDPYLSGSYTPSAGLTISDDEITDAEFIFNNDASMFDLGIGVVDLYDGSTLKLERYSVISLDPSEYSDDESLKVAMMNCFLVNLAATGMKLVGG